MRDDQRELFERISDRKTVEWYSGRASYLYHATADGQLAVCSSNIQIDRERDEYPSTTDRSNNTMTCDSCQALVRKVRWPTPWWRKSASSRR